MGHWLVGQLVGQWLVCWDCWSSYHWVIGQDSWQRATDWLHGTVGRSNNWVVWTIGRALTGWLDWLVKDQWLVCLGLLVQSTEWLVRTVGRGPMLRKLVMGDWLNDGNNWWWTIDCLALTVWTGPLIGQKGQFVVEQWLVGHDFWQWTDVQTECLPTHGLWHWCRGDLTTDYSPHVFIFYVLQYFHIKQREIHTHSTFLFNNSV